MMKKRVKYIVGEILFIAFGMGLFAAAGLLDSEFNEREQRAEVAMVKETLWNHAVETSAPGHAGVTYVKLCDEMGW
jgi:hypothetical protein